jgi:hypothetical protein
MTKLALRSKKVYGEMQSVPNGKGCKSNYRVAHSIFDIQGALGDLFMDFVLGRYRKK